MEEHEHSNTVNFLVDKAIILFLKNEDTVYKNSNQSVYIPVNYLLTFSGASVPLPIPRVALREGGISIWRAQCSVSCIYKCSSNMRKALFDQRPTHLKHEGTGCLLRNATKVFPNNFYSI